MNVRTKTIVASMVTASVLGFLAYGLSLDGQTAAVAVLEACSVILILTGLTLAVTFKPRQRRTRP